MVNGHKGLFIVQKRGYYNLVRRTKKRTITVCYMGKHDTIEKAYWFYKAEALTGCPTSKANVLILERLRTDADRANAEAAHSLLLKRKELLVKFNERQFALAWKQQLDAGNIPNLRRPEFKPATALERSKAAYLAHKTALAFIKHICDPFSAERERIEAEHAKVVREERRAKARANAEEAHQQARVHRGSLSLSELHAASAELESKIKLQHNGGAFKLAELHAQLSDVLRLIARLNPPSH